MPSRVSSRQDTNPVTFTNTRQVRLVSQYNRTTTFAGLNGAKILVVEHKKKISLLFQVIVQINLELSIHITNQLL